MRKGTPFSSKESIRVVKRFMHTSLLLTAVSARQKLHHFWRPHADIVITVEFLSGASQGLPLLNFRAGVGKRESYSMKSQGRD
jgi:hypothetical protein